MNEPRHLFECEYPIPEGELIYKQHPKIGHLISNWGTADDKLPHYQFGRGKNLAIMVYETWVGDRPYGAKIVHLNNNPYDCRPSNLGIAKEVESEERTFKRKQFNELTMEEMLKRERKFCNCADALKHWEALGVKKAYVSMWRNRTRLCPKQKDQ